MLFLARNLFGMPLNVESMAKFSRDPREQEIRAEHSRKMDSVRRIGPTARLAVARSHKAEGGFYLGA
jgi:hypothetical protein